MKKIRDRDVFQCTITFQHSPGGTGINNELSKWGQSSQPRLELGYLLNPAVQVKMDFPCMSEEVCSYFFFQFDYL